MIAEQTIAVLPKVPIPYSEMRVHIRAEASLKFDRVGFQYSMRTSRACWHEIELRIELKQHLPSEERLFNSTQGHTL